MSGTTAARPPVRIIGNSNSEVAPPVALKQGLLWPLLTGKDTKLCPVLALMQRGALDKLGQVLCVELSGALFLLLVTHWLTCLA